MAKSFLEKLGIVQNVPEDNSQKGDAPDNKDLFSGVKSQDVSSVSTKEKFIRDVDKINIVEQAYSTLPASNINIFVVEELLKNFEALPEEQRFITVQATLRTMGFKVEDFAMDASVRKSAILNTLKKTQEHIENQSEDIAKKIEEIKAQIDELTKKKLSINNGFDESKKQAKKEYDRLDAIIKVLGGTNTQKGGN